jgi:hypothetical protein
MRRSCGTTGTTMRGNQGRLRLPPQAVRTEGPPKGADAPMNQSREAHHTARPLHSPEGNTSGNPPSAGEGVRGWRA